MGQNQFKSLGITRLGTFRSMCSAVKMVKGNFVYPRNAKELKNLF